MAKRNSFVSRKLRHALRPDQIFPMILKNKNNKNFVNKSYKISYAVNLGNLLVLNTSKSTSNQILKKKSNQIKNKKENP